MDGSDASAEVSPVSESPSVKMTEIGREGHSGRYRKRSKDS